MLTADFHGFRIDETCRTDDFVDVRIGQVSVIPVVDAVHIVITRLFQPGPVKIDGGYGKTVAGRILDSVGDVRTQPHHLLGYATDIDTGATERALFNNRTLFAIARGALGHGQAATTPADGNQVIMLCH